MDLGYVKAYRRLKELFQSPSLFRDTEYRMKMNPPKQAFEFGRYRTGDCIEKSANIMYAKTDKGIFTKVISIDDSSGKWDERVIYVSNGMEVTDTCNIGLTRLRCAMMATLAVDLNHYGDSSKEIGFIGSGKINLKTAELLNAHFGIHNFVIRGSSRCRSYNAEKFRSFGSVKVDGTESLEILNMCDIVISCTNSCDKKNLISIKQLPNPSLFIAQDSGYIFDESFRQDYMGIPCYTDHPEQIEAHFKDEFPFDMVQNRHFQLLEESYLKHKKQIYLYGIAMADAIIFEEMFLGR